MRERYLCTTLKLKTNSFWRQKAGLEVLIKVTLLKKTTIKNQFFVPLFLLSFHLSASELTFIKASNLTLYRKKEFVLNLKVVHK